MQWKGGWIVGVSLELLRKYWKVDNLLSFVKSNSKLFLQSDPFRCMLLHALQENLYLLMLCEKI